MLTEVVMSSLQVAQAFGLQWHDVEDQQACKELLKALLTDKSLYTPAVGLLMQFPVSHQMFWVLWQILLQCIAELIASARLVLTSYSMSCHDLAACAAGSAAGS